MRQILIGLTSNLAALATALLVANAARLEAENIWGQNAQGLSTVANVPQAVPAVAGERVQWFAWSDLADADQHPVIALVGGMGAGKTRLAKYIARHVVARPGEQIDAVAFDLYADTKAWEGFNCIWNHQEMVAQMASDLAVLRERAADYRQGKRDFTPIFRAFDESKFSIPQIRKLGAAKAQTLESWQDQYGSVTRKIRARVCYLNTSLTAEALGMSANERGDVTIIFPGEKGIAKAMQDSRLLKLGTRANAALRQQLTAALQQLPPEARPALVFHDGQWFPAAVPQLDEQGNPPGVAVAVTPRVSTTDNRRERLEQLLQQSAVRPTSKPENKLTRLLDYIRRNGPVKRRTILRNWAQNHGVNALLMDQMLETLTTAQTVVISSQGYEMVLDDTSSLG